MSEVSDRTGDGTGDRTQGRPRRRPVRATVVLVVVGLLLAACGGGGDGGDAAGPSSRPETSIVARRVGDLMVQPLHSNLGQSYDYRTTDGTITVSAPETNDPLQIGRLPEMGDRDIAQAFSSAGQLERSDHQVCVTLDSVVDGSTAEAAAAALQDRSIIHLPGVALRIRPGVNGGPSRAITITQSAYRAKMSIFMVALVRADVSDTGAVASTTPIEALDFRHLLGDATGFDAEGEGSIETTLEPPPWHVCARVLGTTLSMMVWIDGDEQPTWDDEDHVRELKLAPHLVYPGYAGGYQQGLSPGRESVFSDLEVTSPY